MRKSIVFTCAMLIVSVTAAAAVAESRLIGSHTEGEIESACLKNGGKVENYPGGSFGCKTEKGEVFCKKTGTLNQGAVGSCMGCNPACGQGAKPGGKTTRTIGEVLTNAPIKTAQPLAPQNTTRPATSTPRSTASAPTQPLTRQKTARSPKTTSKQPPTQQQKTTGAAGGHLAQPLAASTSSRRSAR
jgi:hypothetical protein